MFWNINTKIFNKSSAKTNDHCLQSLEGPGPPRGKTWNLFQLTRYPNSVKKVDQCY